MHPSLKEINFDLKITWKRMWQPGLLPKRPGDQARLVPTKEYSPPGVLVGEGRQRAAHKAERRPMICCHIRRSHAHTG